MATIVTRAGKGSPLTNTELDANFTNINADLAAAVVTRGTAVINTSDWNTFTSPGSYSVNGWTGGTSTNGPTGSYAWGQLIVTVNGNVVTQMYITHGNTRIWARSKFNAADWTSWLQYATIGDIPTNNTQLTNGAGYITASASITGNAATASAVLATNTNESTLASGHPGGASWINYRGAAAAITSYKFCNGLGGTLVPIETAGATFSGTVTYTQGNNLGMRFGAAGAKIDAVDNSNIVIRSNILRLGSQGATWDYDEWAGIKWDNAAKTLYIGSPRAGTTYWNNNAGTAVDTTVNFVGVTDNGLQVRGNPVYTTANTPLPIYQYRGRWHATDGTSINNAMGGIHGFDYDTAGSGVTGPFISFGGLGGGTGTYPMQIVGAYNNASGDFKVRTRNDDTGSWNPWRTLYHSGNIVPVGNGGTGASDAATARANLGVYAASDTIMTPSNMAYDISNTDLNNRVATGFFRGCNVVNAPNSGWWYFIIESHDTTGWIKQTATAYGSGNGSYPAGATLVRLKVSGAWSAWQLVTFNDSPSFTGNPTAPTPAQFDNDTSIATTAFVKTAGYQFSKYTVKNATGTLAASDAGSLLLCSAGAAITLTLPLASGMRDGDTLRIQNVAPYDVTVQRQGATEYINANATQINSLVVKQGEFVDFVAASSGVWLATGTGALQFSGSFAASKAANGYQKLPSGLIIQWGESGCAADSTTTVAVPIAFPNAFLQVVVSVRDSVATKTAFPYSTAIPISLSGFVLRSYYSNSAISNSWIAIGY